MKRLSSADGNETLYMLYGRNSLKEWLAITVYRYQWVFLPTFGIFRTRRNNRDWRIAFSWFNLSVSIMVYMQKGEEECG